MATVHMVLMILAIVCFFLGALKVQPPRGEFIAGGLCLWALATIIG